MHLDRTRYVYEAAYREGYTDGYADVCEAVRDRCLDMCRQLSDCLRAILVDGEAPAHAMDDGRAENRREERTALSADGIRA